MAARYFTTRLVVPYRIVSAVRVMPTDVLAAQPLAPPGRRRRRRRASGGLMREHGVLNGILLVYDEAIPDRCQTGPS